MNEQKDQQSQTFTFGKDQGNAWKMLLGKSNLVILGVPGAGKTELLKRFLKEKENTVVLAPTGIVAQAIGGSTIHRFFGFPMIPMNKEKNYYNDKLLLEKLKIIDTYVIDEISMVRSDFFTNIDLILQFATGCKKPFGGKRMIVMGDFCQLPPIVKKPNDRDYLIDTFGGIYAFQSASWKKANFETVFLHENFRQGINQKLLVAFLDSIRNGMCNRSLLNTFNCRVMKNGRAPEGVICLCPTRNQVKQINIEQSASLDSTPYVYNAIVSADFPPDEYPTEKQLSLKKGARVMCVCNIYDKDSRRQIAANGDCGCIVDTMPNCVKVRYDKDVEHILNVYPQMFIYTEHEIQTKNNKKRVVATQKGSFLQIPLRLAYAMTIHKSQGQTLNSMTLILGNCGCFAPFQLYTALSRVKDIDQLYMDRPITNRDVIIEETASHFCGLCELMPELLLFAFLEMVHQNPPSDCCTLQLELKKAYVKYQDMRDRIDLKQCFPDAKLKPIVLKDGIRIYEIIRSYEFRNWILNEDQVSTLKKIMDRYPPVK